MTYTDHQSLNKQILNHFFLSSLSSREMILMNWAQLTTSSSLMLSFSQIALPFAPKMSCSICCQVKSSSRSSTTFVNDFLVITLGSLLQSTKSLQAFWISSLLSFWLIFTIIISKNYWKSIFVSSNLAYSLPFPKSLIKLLISSLLGSNPNALNTTFKFLAQMVPEPEMSKKSKAFLISFFCEAVRTCWLFSIFFLLVWVFGTGGAFCALPLGCICNLTFKQLILKSLIFFMSTSSRVPLSQ